MNLFERLKVFLFGSDRLRFKLKTDTIYYSRLNIYYMLPGKRRWRILKNNAGNEMYTEKGKSIDFIHKWTSNPKLFYKELKERYAYYDDNLYFKENKLANDMDEALR